MSAFSPWRTGWLFVDAKERFAERRGGIQGHFYYEHPMAEGSNLREAFDILRQEEVIKLFDVKVPASDPNAGFIRGYFQPAKRFAAYLRDDLKPRQLSLLESPDIFDPTKEPKLIPAAAASDNPYNEYIAALFDFLQRKVKISSQLILEARQAGWTQLALLHVVITAMDGIRDNVAGYAASIIRKGIDNPVVRESFEDLKAEHQGALRAVAVDPRAPQWDATQRRVIYPRRTQ